MISFNTMLQTVSDSSVWNNKPIASATLIWVQGIWEKYPLDFAEKVLAKKAEAEKMGECDERNDINGILFMCLNLYRLWEREYL